MIVCGFMIRMSPFTEIFLALQVSCTAEIVIDSFRAETLTWRTDCFPVYLALGILPVQTTGVT